MRWKRTLCDERAKCVDRYDKIRNKQKIVINLLNCAIKIMSEMERGNRYEKEIEGKKKGFLYSDRCRNGVDSGMRRGRKGTGR